MSVTSILFCVRVPVLSEQMTLTQPRVSTIGRRFTITLFFAILITPRASVTVTTMGRPSGIAATAKLCARRDGGGGGEREGEPEERGLNYCQITIMYMKEQSDATLLLGFQ